MRAFMAFLMLVAVSQSPASDMVAESYPLGLLDPTTAETIAKKLASPGGVVILESSGNRLAVVDYPDRHKAIREALEKTTPPTEHVRVLVMFKGQSAAKTDSAAVVVTTGDQGQIRPIPESSTRISADIGLEKTEHAGNSVVNQELLLLSGTKGKIRIGTDVPYSEWIWNYGENLGLWTGTMRWKEVGTSLVVSPLVIRDQIRVRLTPEVSYLLDGQSLATAVETLTTEVIVKNGEEIDLGGLPVNNREFYDKFLVGYSHQGTRQSLNISLKVTVE